MLKFVVGFAVCWAACLVVTSQAAAFVRHAKSFGLTYPRVVAGQQSLRSLTTSSLTEDAKQEILDMHNELRRLEPAANMEKMVWNDYLADMGDVWARMCLWDHGQPSNMTSAAPYSPIGQNLYVTTAAISPGIDEVGIQLWYDEIVDYDFATATCNEGKVCGHYTQVVWATSREVGCGYYVCPSIKVGTSTWNDAYYLVCNYGPAGNWLGEQPYELGDSCSNCHPDRPYCDSKLCTAEQPQPPATTEATLTEATTAAITTRAPTERTTQKIVASTVTPASERTTQVSAETTTNRTAMATTVKESTTQKIVASTVTPASERTTHGSAETTTNRTAMATTVKETLSTTVKTESTTKNTVVVTEEQTTVNPGVKTTATQSQAVTTDKITTQTGHITTVAPSGEQTEESSESTVTPVVTTMRPGRPGRPGPGRRPVKVRTSITANSRPEERKRKRPLPNRANKNAFKKRSKTS